MTTDATIVLSHFQRETLKTLDRELHTASPPLPEGWHASPSAKVARDHMFDEYRRVLRKIREDVDMREPSSHPATLCFEGGLRALNRIEQFRHVLDNLLEAVKRGDSLQHTVIDYVYIGLIQEPSTVLERDDSENSPWRSNRGAGLFIRSLLKGLRTVALAVIELVTHALKALPNVAVKPKPSVGVVGPAPSFSLELEPELESVTLRDIFQQFANAGNIE